MFHSREGDDTRDEGILTDGELARTDFGIGADCSIVHCTFDETVDSLGIEGTGIEVLPDSCCQQFGIRAGVIHQRLPVVFVRFSGD